MCLADVGDVCPSAGTWLPTPISSDTAVSNAADESVNSAGYESSCKGGGTGWHATKGGANVVVTCYHVFGSSGHAVSPDISARNCQLYRLVYTGKNNCVSPYFVSPCYVLTEGMESTELGLIQGGIKPQAQPAVNLDDVSYSKGEINGMAAAGNMVSTIANIGAVGIPVPIASVGVGLAVQYNGATSCHQHGLVQNPNVSLVCEPNNGPCFAHLIQVGITADTGDSGSLGVTDIGNNPVGMLSLKGPTGTNIGYFFPIGQVVNDLGLDTVVGSSPGAKVSPAPVANAEIKSTISRNAWIAKLKHVSGVSYGLVRGEVAIIVEVDKAENVGEVSRKVPSRIEGFPVDVEEVPTGYPL